MQQENSSEVLGDTMKSNDYIGWHQPQADQNKKINQGIIYTTKMQVW